MKKKLSFTLILILFGAIFTSCKKDKGEPPVLPPQESMTIDFSNFAYQKKSSDQIYEQKGTDNSNWEFAATAAGIWKLLINSTLAVPVASFKLAANQLPVYLSEKTWQWSYTVSVANINYKARLTGQIRTTDVVWKMYITKEGTGGFAEFLWFEGTSKLDGNSGQWILYESFQSQLALLQIDWTKTGSSIGNVKYTLIKNDAFKTSYLEYGLTSALLNAYFTIHYYNGLKFSDVLVEWNTTTLNGRVRSIDFMGDNTWHCWDSNKNNVTCL
jgi:hypothetical protein